MVDRSVVHDAQTNLTTLPVRCLVCARAYEKPDGGGNLVDNPGCPMCGYLGWVARSRSLWNS